MLQSSNNNVVKPAIEDINDERKANFTPEVSGFIFDFFRLELNGYEQLLFYAHFIIGMSLESLADRFHCSFQRVDQLLSGIRRRLKHSWENQDTWRSKHDCKQRN